MINFYHCCKKYQISAMFFVHYNSLTIIIFKYLQKRQTSRNLIAEKLYLSVTKLPAFLYKKDNGNNLILTSASRRPRPRNTEARPSWPAAPPG